MNVEKKIFMSKSILITGVGGFIGSKLATKLLTLGYDVTGIDLLKYDSSSLNHLFLFSNFKFIKADITKENIIKKFIKNKNFVIPLAALVGAPLCEKFKKEAISVNVESIKLIIKHIKKNQNIVYPTTNSGYGIGEKGFCTETSPLRPISLYGKTKVEAEKIIMEHENAISFRLATVFGYSYRMRTDLLVNNFVYNAVKSKQLKIFEPHFRRNFIHIDDVVRAFVFAIANFDNMKSNIYNLGLSSANISKIQLAKKIKKNIPGLKISTKINSKDPDKRDYFVSNKKIEKKGFKAIVSLDLGIKELIKVFSNSDKNIINNY
jgi:nucleoside-diphosphate-sugar epimerase